jgi:o-succinylbenzoate synthase
MKIHASYARHDLVYKKPIRTSRGEMTDHTAWYLRLGSAGSARTGWGEASPLPGLSVDDIASIEHALQQVCEAFNKHAQPDRDLLHKFPSVAFAVETALKDLQGSRPFILYPSSFTEGSPLSINGLVWMATPEQMLEEAFSKIRSGYDCIKFKVGAHDFDEECRMIEAVRRQFSSFRLSIRLDANGAFTAHDAREKLKDLSRFDIHSIEQPVKPGQPDLMAALCSERKIPVALDEELIGIPSSGRNKLLRMLKPSWIILKPGLLGGIRECEDWITCAEAVGTGYWVTSALESNIGLNAIAQWAATLPVALPQGLGTGALYQNNIPFPLHAGHGQLRIEASGLDTVASALISVLKPL